MKWSVDTYHSTFIVSNIALQASYFNEHLWQKIEVQERGWACDHGPIYPVNGVKFAATNGTLRSPKDPTMVSAGGDPPGARIPVVYDLDFPLEAGEVQSGA